MRCRLRHLTITDQARRSIEVHVGAIDPGPAVYYTYDGDDVADGLLGFDTWLQANERTNLGLVQVATRADYLLSILHPRGDIDQLVEALEQIGIEARAQSTGPWPESSTVAHYNVCEHIEHQLMKNHDFEWIDNQLVKKSRRSAFDRCEILAILTRTRQRPWDEP